MDNVAVFPAARMQLADEAAEDAVLGALLNAEGHPLDCREEVVELFTPGGSKIFTSLMNARIYDAFIDCLVGGTSTSPHGITSALRKKGELTDGIMERVYQLSGAAVQAVEATNGARTLRNLYRRRTVAQVMSEGATAVSSGEKDADTAIADAFGRIATAVEVGETPITRYERDRLVEEGFGVLLGLRRREVGLSYGFEDLDARTSGMHPSHMTAIGARSGDGKTVFGQNVARHAAIKAGIPTCFFSLEMTPATLVQRCAAAELGIPYSFIRDNNLGPSEREKVLAFVDRERENRNYRIEYVPGATAGELYLLARKAVRDMGAKLFVVDYAQLVQADRPLDNMNEKMTETVSRIHDIATKLGVHVMLLTQLRKVTSGQEGTAPTIHDMLYGTRIENTASTILLLQRQLVEGKPGGEASVHAVKNREGTVGEDELIFDGTRMRFLSKNSRLSVVN